jgi:hypothetical protein
LKKIVPDIGDKKALVKVVARRRCVFLNQQGQIRKVTKFGLMGNLIKIWIQPQHSHRSTIYREIIFSVLGGQEKCSLNHP